MASSSKPTINPTARRKSSKPTLVVTLKLSSKALQPFSPKPSPPKEESPVKDPVPEPSTQPAATSPNGDNPSDSNANTPAAAGTPNPTLMLPPTEGKKKGTKRGAPVDPNAPPKVRGKPGPKKKARLEDGSIDHSATVPRAANGTAHKLGPKANQGAINAGLRALDRSGKPCRKWQKGSFTMKSFTGVVWEIPRWRAPPKTIVDTKPEDQSTTSDDSRKENKDNSQMESTKSEKSNSGGEVENRGTPNQNVSSPAPSIPSIPTAPAADATPVVTASA